jgi:hypothetical protein
MAEVKNIIYKRTTTTPEVKDTEGNITSEASVDSYYNDEKCTEQNVNFSSNTENNYEVKSCPLPSQLGGRRRSKKSKKSKKAKKTKKSKKSKKTKKSRKH